MSAAQMAVAAKCRAAGEKVIWDRPGDVISPQVAFAIGVLTGVASIGGVTAFVLEKSAVLPRLFDG